MLLPRARIFWTLATGTLLTAWAFTAQASAPSTPLPDLELQRPRILGGTSNPGLGERLQLDLGEGEGALVARRGAARRSAVRAARVGLKSPAAAWALSFFVSFGAGNYYARAIGVAVFCTVSEVIAATLTFVGAYYSLYLFVPALIAWGGLWVFDWVYAIVAARAYNARVTFLDVPRDQRMVSVPSPQGRELAFAVPVFSF